MSYWTSTYPSRLGLYLIQRDRLIDRYSMPTRTYHNWSHIESCLETLDNWAKYTAGTAEREAIEIALLYHDVYYSASSKMNEDESALLLSKAPIHAALKAWAMDMVYATKTHEMVGNTGTNIMLSIDLAGLAKPYEKFQVDSENIIREYCWSFKRSKVLAGRIDWLTKFAARPYIYPFVHVDDFLAGQARDNMWREAGRLRGLLSQEVEDG